MIQGNQKLAQIVVKWTVFEIILAMERQMERRGTAFEGWWTTIEGVDKISQERIPRS